MPPEPRRFFRNYDIDSLENRDPELLGRLVDLLEPLLWRYFQPVVRGLERIPSGSGLYVGNHNSGLLSPDTFIFGIAVLRRRGIADVPFGLGHELAIRIPGIHQVVMPLGAVRASHEHAHALFAGGKKVLVYPGGDLDSMRAYRDRDRIIFGPRRGYVRLALRERVPIVPIVTAGAQETYVVLDDGAWLAEALGIDRWFRMKVWPITLSIPWGLTIGPPPPYFPLRTRIYIEALEAIRFERQGEEAAADEAYVEACHLHVLSTMQGALDRLAADRRAGAA